MRRGRLIAAWAAAPLALSLVLGACGKKGNLRAPDGEAAAYTYPRAYPKPATVLPAGSALERPRSRERPRGAGDISPLPQPHRVTTYGDPEDTQPEAQ